MLIAECKLFLQSCFISIDFIKDRGVFIDSNLHFHYHSGHAFFSRQINYTV